MSEVWRPVPGWEDIYEVSDLGRVRSLDRVVAYRDGLKRRLRGRVLKPYPAPGGYPQVVLSYPEKGQRNCSIHRAVLEAFVGPAPKGYEACHNNGVPSDNRLENLRWDTSSANNLDKRKHGTDHEVRKTHCPRGHILEDPNLVLSQKPGRTCLACARARSRVFHHPDLKPQMQEVSDNYYSAIVAQGKSAPRTKTPHPATGREIHWHTTKARKEPT